MEPEPKYQLVLWFDQKQVEFNELYNFVNNGLTADVESKVGYSSEGDLTLSLVGTLEKIDKGHFEIIRLTQRTNWNVFRLKDTAGDEIRCQAYSELSKIEQELRLFINRGLIDVFGFDWWKSLGSLKIPGLEDPPDQKIHHPLELMTIYELIELVTFEKSEWGEDSNISMKDLTTVLSSSNNFDEFRKIITQKSQKIKFWDLVFAKYLGEKAPLWKEIRKNDLQFVIDLRNKVMHHRPVGLGELKDLGEKQKRIVSLIASAKTHLSDDEKREIVSLQKEARDIFAQMIYERSPLNNYQRLYDSLQKARISATVRNLENEIDTFTKTEILTVKESLELNAVAFDKLQTLTNYGLNETQQIIINELLPLCLHEDVELNLQYGAFRNILIEWIKNHSQQDASILKNLILDHLSGLIGTDKHNATCWTISRLGFAREDIVQQLLDFAHRADNQSGDNALYTLTWLRFSRDQRNTILSELHSRAGKRYNNVLVWSLARLGDSSSFSIILREWLQADKIIQKGVDPSIAFTAIREIADTNDNDLDFQDVIWKETSLLVEQNPQGLYFPFDIGHLVTTCNSALVVPTLLRWHGQHPEWFKDPAWARYLAQEHLEAAIKPLQLEGWLRIDDRTVFNVLQQDACRNSENDSYAQTEASIVKEAAWKTILSAGYSDALCWFEPAVSDETGRFIRQKVMYYLSAFKIEPLPATAVHWITQEFDDTAEGDARELSYRMAAVRLASSQSSMDAFETLLNFGYTRKGQVLQESMDAVAQVTLALLVKGHTNIIESLVELATKSDLKRQRIVAVYALESIATNPEYVTLLKPYRDRLIPIAYDENRYAIERGQALSIIANLPGDISEKFEKDLIAWSQESDRWIRVGSLQVLAWNNKLEDYPDLMRDILNLEKDEENQWKWSTGKIKFEWASYILGILYHRNPEAYSKGVSYLLENQDWESVAQIYDWLKQTHIGDGKSKLSEEVCDALFKRLMNKMSRIYSEPQLFEILATLAPDVLVSPDVAKKSSEWMPDSRVALANAIRKANFSKEVQGQYIEILEYLTEDSIYSVRRAAYRAIAAYSQPHLSKLCQSWIESPLLKLNMRAAEAYGWVENINNDKGQDVFEELREVCLSNQEANIREAVKRSWKERRHRQWAKIYLEKVLAIQGGDNNEVLQAWRYGDALTRTGDDETRELLVEHLTNRQLSLNVRFWISKHILESLENNWKKVTEKWPEPWVDSHGSIQRGKGKLIISPEKSVDVQYSIWFNSAMTPAEKHSWGGTLIIFLGDVLNVDHAVLELENKQKGNVLFGSILGNSTTFTGTGPYPS